jgi:hypothetical protein
MDVGVVFVGAAVSVGVAVIDGAHEAKIKMKSEITIAVFVFKIAYLLQGTAQRFALVACGRAWTMFESRKSPKPEKCL